MYDIVYTMKVETKKKGRVPSNSKAFEKISKLEPGAVLIFKKEDWKLGTPPSKSLLRQYTGRHFSVQTLADDSGWLIRAL